MKAATKKFIDKVATYIARNKAITIALLSGLVAFGAINAEKSETIANVVVALASVVSALI